MPVQARDGRFGPPDQIEQVCAVLPPASLPPGPHTFRITALDGAPVPNPSVFEARVFFVSPVLSVECRGEAETLC